MSMTGAFVVAAICLARLPLKKAPKILSYCLWAVAGFRLIFPFSIESSFSLIPFDAQTIIQDVAAQPNQDVASHAIQDVAAQPIQDGASQSIQDMATANTTAANNASANTTIAVTDVANAAAVNTAVVNEATHATSNPLHSWLAISSWIWLVGAGLFLAIGAVFYIRLKHKMASAIRVEGNLYETDGIQSPFVLGIFKPKIYIPLGLSGRERVYLILHERTHIRRYDHIVKFLAYIIICLHWFNPLAWVAFLLMGLDMEMSCDERVLKDMGNGIIKEYSMSLLSLTVGQRIIGNSSMLAFGADGVDKRIKNVLGFKKSSRIAVVFAIVFIMLLTLGLAGSRTGAGLVLNADDDINTYSNTETDINDNAIPGSSLISDVNVETSTKTGAEIDAEADVEVEAEAVIEKSINADAGAVIGANTGLIYRITDYYNIEDGKFSVLGTSLSENNSERALTVSRGDVLIAGEHQYEVVVDSLTLSFYTQPTLDQVVQWWGDYLDSWAQSGKVVNLS